MAKKDYTDDDGRTIVDMNVDGFRWYKPKNEEGKKAVAGKSRKEKKRLFRSAYLSLALPLICLLVGVSLTFFILYYFWL